MYCDSTTQHEKKQTSGLHRKGVLTTMLLAGVLSTLLADASAQIIYVDRSQPPGGTGVSWATAYKRLQPALAQATALGGAEIRVAEGKYYPSYSGDQAASFQLTQDVRVHGGYQAGGAAWDPSIYQTILSGNINNPALASDDSFHVVNVTGGSTSSARLDGLKVRRGRAAGSSGGGIVVNSGTQLAVVECIVAKNYATYDGGGMLIQPNAAALVWDSVFRGNTAARYGGGIALLANPSLQGSGLLMGRTRFCDNLGGHGGGIYHDVDCVSTMANSVFTGNRATYDGAAVFVHERDDVSILNCSISYNDALLGRGGGIYQEGGSTFLVVGNTISYFNTAAIGTLEEEQIDSGYGYVYYSCVEGGWTGAGANNTAADPQYASPAGADGVLGTCDDDLRLSSLSALIDAGDNSLLPWWMGNEDFPGNSRYVDDPFTPDTGAGPAPIVDIGAYEFIRLFVIKKPGPGLAGFGVKIR